MTVFLRIRPLFRRLFPVILFFAMAAVTGRSQMLSTFSALAHLPIGGAGLMSGNGHLILGYNYELDGRGKYYDRIYIWRLNSDGWQLEHLTDDNLWPTSIAAVSDDAATIAGYITDPVTYAVIAAVWNYQDGTWVRTNLDSGGVRASVSGLSRNGKVAIGSALNLGQAYIWECLNGKWVGTLLTGPNNARTAAYGVSYDGSMVLGSISKAPYGFIPTIWTKGESGWSSMTLPHDSTTFFTTPTEVTPDGSTITGRTQIKGDDRIAVWNFDGASWILTILPQPRSGYSYGNGMSADGTVIIGDATINSDGGSIRTVWQLKNNKWTVTRSGKLSELDGNVYSLTQDGKLCLADTGNGTPVIWNLVTGGTMTIADLIASVDQNTAATGWDFSYSGLLNIGYDETNNSYNIVGYAKRDGQITHWASTVFAPFLTNGNTIVGQQIDAPLPDHQEGDYTVDMLPSGLTYKSVSRTVSGRPAKQGVFSIRYRSTKGKVRTSLLTVVPMPAKMTGAQTLSLAGANVGDPSPGVLNVKIGPTGSLSGSLKLNSSPKAQTLRISGMMIVGSSGKFSTAYATKTAATPGITLKLGKGTSLVQLQLSLHMSRDGILIAELRDANNNLIGSATSD